MSRVLSILADSITAKWDEVIDKQLRVAREKATYLEVGKGSNICKSSWAMSDAQWEAQYDTWCLQYKRLPSDSWKAASVRSLPLQGEWGEVHMGPVGNMMISNSFLFLKNPGLLEWEMLLKVYPGMLRYLWKDEAYSPERRIPADSSMYTKCVNKQSSCATHVCIFRLNSLAAWKQVSRLLFISYLPGLPWTQ